MATGKTTECRVLERLIDNHGERVHLARLDESHSLCGQVTFDGSPFDPWQIVDAELSPEDVSADRCLSCWEAWEGAKREDRESRGLWNPPARTHTRKPRRRVSPQVATQRIALEAVPAIGIDVIRLRKPELLALGTTEARAELDRRRAKRAAKRAERIAA